MLVDRLNGYVNAIASMDGEFGDCIAGAYVMPLDFNDLAGSLKSHLVQEPANQYLYGAVSKIHKPWSRQLHIALTGFFLQRPLGSMDAPHRERIARTRDALVLRIMDMIGMITDDYACEDIACVEMRSNDGYSGHMYVFPLSQDFLLLKVISRVSGE